MRCVACNSELDDYEATRKDSNGEHYDLCDNCFSEIRKAVWDQDVTVSTVVSHLVVDADEE